MNFSACICALKAHTCVRAVDFDSGGVTFFSGVSPYPHLLGVRCPNPMHNSTPRPVRGDEHVPHLLGWAPLTCEDKSEIRNSKSETSTKFK